MGSFLVNAAQFSNVTQQFKTDAVSFDTRFGAKAEQAEGKSSFNTIFQSYLDLYNQTNELQIDSERLQLDYAAGRTDDMLAVILAQEKAYASLNFTVQVTSRILDAYREIMRMQV